MAIRDVIAETPATAVTGLKFKAKYAAERYGVDSYDEVIMSSIVDDLLAIAESANV
jgi:hypothetical protein